MTCMRILYKPRVAIKCYLPNGEREIEEAARVCWESWGRSDGTVKAAQDMIGRLHKVGHIDTLEESFLSVWIECSRAASHQIVRHRTFHFLQQSQRYVKLDEPEFLVPPSIANPDIKMDCPWDWTAEQEFTDCMQRDWETYGHLRKAGIRAEDARYVLPNATLTKLKASANFNNWRKFMQLRSDTTAQWEIRMISNAVLHFAYLIAPSVFTDIEQTYFTGDQLIADLAERSEFDNYQNWVALEASDGIEEN